MNFKTCSHENTIWMYDILFLILVDIFLFLMCVFYFHKKKTALPWHQRSVSLFVARTPPFECTRRKTFPSTPETMTATSLGGSQWVRGRRARARTRQSIPLIYDSDGDEGVAPARSCGELLTAKLFLISDISIKHPLTLRPGRAGPCQRFFNGSPAAASHHRDMIIREAVVEEIVYCKTCPWSWCCKEWGPRLHLWMKGEKLGS